MIWKWLKAATSAVFYPYSCISSASFPWPFQNAFWSLSMSKTLLYSKGNGFLHISSLSSPVLIHFLSLSSHTLTHLQTTLIHISLQQLHLTVGCIYQRPDCILIHIAIKSCFLSDGFVFFFSFPYLFIFLVFYYLFNLHLHGHWIILISAVFFPFFLYSIVF